MVTVQSTWRSLAKSLSSEDVASPYLERVRDRAGPRHGLRSVQRELIEEMGYALAKAERKVNEALLECDLRALLWLDADDESDQIEHAEEYAAAKVRARRAKWEYMVHREAIGLIWTDEIDREFPIPPTIERRARELDT